MGDNLLKNINPFCESEVITMKKHNRKKEKRQGKSKRFSVRASYIAIGHLVRQWKVLDTIEQKVKIAQKTVKHTP